jgi:hypothetical protein
MFRAQPNRIVYSKRIYSASIDTALKDIGQLVQAHNKKVVLAYYLFSTYIVTAYVNKHSKKAVAIVEFGGILITFYSVIKLLLYELALKYRSIPR